MDYTMWDNTPLKWHKFLTFFVLPLGTVLNICQAILLVSEPNNWVGILIPINTIDLIRFAACSILGIAAIGGCLPSRRKWYGPMCAIILYAVLSAYSIYNIIAAYLLDVADGEFITQSIANLISFSATSGLMYIYYRKRRALFSASRQSIPQILVKPAETSQQIDEKNEAEPEPEPENSVDLLMKIQNDNEINNQQSKEVKLEKKLKQLKILCCILAFLLAVSLIETIYLWNSYNDHAQTYYEAGYSDGKAAGSTRSNANDMSNDLQEVLDQMREYGIKRELVYVTESGSKYHDKWCQYVNDRSAEFAMPLEQAVENGYEPCSVCDPPRM